MKPLVAKGRRLPPPTIIFGQEKESMIDRDSGKWHVRDSFYLPATIEKWAIYLIPSARTKEKNRFGENEMKLHFIFLLNFLLNFLRLTELIFQN